MYENPVCFVQSIDGPTKEFQTTSGILQGDTLAPFLFVIVVDYVLRQAMDTISPRGLTIGRRSGRQSQKWVTNLDYADDIALIAEYISSAQELLTLLEVSAAKVGLFMLNAKKTECLPLNEVSDHPT